MAFVEPNPDIYGQHAARSALADFLEVMALRAPSLTESELADLLDDNHWRLKNKRYHLAELDLSESLTDPEAEEGDTDGDDDIETNYEETARMVFELIDERRRILKTRYPFTIVAGRLRYQAGADRVYLFFLAISILHSRNLASPAPAWEIFEGSVLTILKNEPLLAASISAHRRDGLGFSDALIKAAADIELIGRPDQLTYSVAAHDEGSDVIANYWWRDDRPGHWVLVGQATCVKDSLRWKPKMQELSGTSYWAKGLGVINQSAVCGFLAVPYHVEPDHFEYLVNRCDGFVLDRLRLVGGQTILSGQEDDFVKALLLDVETKLPSPKANAA